MKREVVKIDENLCNGCGECVPGCHEGALQVIDGKARLISDLMCDGLGACIGHCPVGAIEIEVREAEAYNETKVMELMVSRGKNTVIAHLKHLKEHNEIAYLQEGIRYLQVAAASLPFHLEEVLSQVHNHTKPPVFQPAQVSYAHQGGGCPGSQAKTIVRAADIVTSAGATVGSELRQWPVQLHLVNPGASYFQNADVVLAADCVAFAMGDFHSRFLKGKSLAIACPKLDNGLDVYRDKITALVDKANINTLTVVIMQVPCCRGLLQVAQDGVDLAAKKVPVKLAVVSAEGEVIEERWV